MAMEAIWDPSESTILIKQAKAFADTVALSRELITQADGLIGVIGRTGVRPLPLLAPEGDPLLTAGPSEASLSQPLFSDVALPQGLSAQTQGRQRGQQLWSKDRMDGLALGLAVQQKLAAASDQQHRLQAVAAAAPDLRGDVAANTVIGIEALRQLGLLRSLVAGLLVSKLDPARLPTALGSPP